MSNIENCGIGNYNVINNPDDVIFIKYARMCRKNHHPFSQKTSCVPTFFKMAVCLYEHALKLHTLSKGERKKNYMLWHQLSKA